MLLLRLKIQPNEWDFLIVGDGSGSNWNYQSGWASISIEKETLKRRAWYGAMNCGTVNFSEMMAYLQPLNWYVAAEANRRSKSGKVRFRDVHIVTDSKYCRDRGESPDSAPRRNSALWRVFDEFKRHGLLLHWHWIPRASVALNVYADKLSKEARLALKNSDVQDVVDGGFDNYQNVYDCNP
jgi:ribonuclease HI